MEPGLDPRISPRTLDILDGGELCPIPWEENRESLQALPYDTGKGRKGG
jgi:hypothetical protein